METHLDNDHNLSKSESEHGRLEETSDEESSDWDTDGEFEPTPLDFPEASIPNPIPECRSFCSECQKIDFDLLAKLDVALVRSPKANNGLLVAHLSTKPPTSACDLCQFFHDAIRAADIFSKTVGLRAYSLLQRYNRHQEYKYNIAPSILSPAQDLVCLRLDTNDIAEPLRSQSQLIFISDEKKTEKNLFSPKILSHLANLDTARKWIEYCRHYHPHCQTQRGSATGLRLIDCYTHVVVRQDFEDYLALSYVWGSVDDGPITAPFPKTIQDAVWLTKALGFRYLWVDQYCIDQNNKEDKHNQIQQMDAIYQNAFLTIVAASGADSNSGIAGVQGTSRKRQPVLSIGNLTLINTLARPHLAIKKSIWSTRGWTLQEVAVTKRKLVFTDEQMYFECMAMSCHESIQYDLPELHRITESWCHLQIHPVEALGATRIQEGLRPGATLTIATQHARFETLRQQYSKRHLTYETDSLNAFLGILKQIELPVPSQDDPRIMFWLVSIWGVPYENSSSSTLHSRLTSFLDHFLWYHLRCGLVLRGVGSTRRRNFPSWSWVGWEGEVTNLRRPSPSNEYWLATPQLAHLKLEYDKSTLVAFEDLPADFKDARISFSQPSALHFDAIVVQSCSLRFVGNKDIAVFIIGDRSASLWLSFGPRDWISLNGMIATGRYLLAFMRECPDHNDFLVFEDHGDYCTRVGIATVLFESIFSRREDFHPQTYTRHIRLM